MEDVKQERREQRQNKYKNILTRFYTNLKFSCPHIETNLTDTFNMKNQIRWCIQKFPD